MIIVKSIGDVVVKDTLKLSNTNQALIYNDSTKPITIVGVTDDYKVSYVKGIQGSLLIDDIKLLLSSSSMGVIIIKNDEVDTVSIQLKLSALGLVVLDTVNNIG